MRRSVLSCVRPSSARDPAISPALSRAELDRSPTSDYPEDPATSPTAKPASRGRLIVLRERFDVKTSSAKDQDDLQGENRAPERCMFGEEDVKAMLLSSSRAGVFKIICPGASARQCARWPIRTSTKWLVSFAAGR